VKLLIWDFDGTLGYRDGGAWAASLLEVLQRAAPESDVTLDDVRRTTLSGFPWQMPEQPHLHLQAADAWWAALEERFVVAYEGLGFPAAQAHELAREVRPTYLAPERWRLYEDAVPTLKALTAAGWTHAMLTNHVPEFQEIAAGLGLTSAFARICNSAEMGYEKPHPRAFAGVLEAFPGASPRWMIGDNYHADVLGAEAVGLPAILVRRFHTDAKHYAETLREVPAIVG
jgi:putative hydrolase of the HAD superfamily